VLAYRVLQVEEIHNTPDFGGDELLIDIMLREHARQTEEPEGCEKRKKNM